MAQIARYYVFIDGKTTGGLVNADRLNGNLDAILAVVNGNIEDDNIKAGAKVLVSDRNYQGADKITGAFEFDAFPTVPAGSLPDAALSANVPLKNAANAFAAKQTLAAGADFQNTQAENFVAEKVAALPGFVVGDAGRLLYCTGDNKWYGGVLGTGWVQLDYIGAYTGGAIRSYTASGEVDDGDSFQIFFKTEGAAPNVRLTLKGIAFPKRHYTELPYHTHVFAGASHSHAISDPGHFHQTFIDGHTHSGTFGSQNHTHTISGNSGNQSANHTHGIAGATAQDGLHQHGGVQGGIYDTDQHPGHTHSINLTSGGISADHNHFLSLSSSSPSATGSIGWTDLGTKTSDSKTTGISAGGTVPSGTNAHSGVNIGSGLSAAQKLYGKNLAVQIDGTDITNAIKAATGWAGIGDGTGAHPFHTAGTGELNASGYMAYPAGLHTLIVSEPETGFGCGVLVHIETS